LFYLEAVPTICLLPAIFAKSKISFMTKEIVFLIASVVVGFGCPKNAGAPDTTAVSDTDSISRVVTSQSLSDWGWNPTVVFPELELPEVFPDPLQELENGIPSDAVYVDRSNIGDGSIFNDPNKRFFVVAPGDYSYLGRITLDASGKPGQRRVIMARGAEPWKKAEDQRARLEAFDVLGDGWVFYNLEFYGNSKEHRGITAGFLTRFMEVDNCTVARCMWRNAQAGLRIYGNYNTVQNSLFMEKPRVGSDVWGVAIFARDGKISRGNRVIGCEFIGMSDGVGVPWDAGGDGGSTPATVIAYNHSWVPKSMYTTMKVEGKTFIMACAEDGYDIKNGARTNDPADQSLFIGNVSRGHRTTDRECGGTGSSGAGWIFHRRARNWLIMGNISYDDAQGCFIKGYSRREGGKDRVENIIMRQNVFANLAPTFAGGVGGMRENPNNGLAMRVMCPSCEVYQNIIVDAEKDCFAERMQANFHDNMYVGVRERTQPGHRSESEVQWRNVQIKASPLLNPKETLNIRVPLRK
jgi:hypothetical protein